MANNRTLTSANAVLMIGAIGLYDAPRQIQGFSADDVTDMDPLTLGETSMGVDGRLSAGFVFNAIMQNITLQADSQSNDVFENIIAAEKQKREKFVLFGSVLIRATERRYTMTRGFITSVSVMPALRKTLQPRRYTLTWQKVEPGPV